MSQHRITRKEPASARGIKAALALLLMFTLVLAWSSHLYAQERLILGVHPYLHHKEIKERFTPLADYLSAELGTPVEVRIGQNYQAHLRAIANNQIDIAYLGPALYVKMLQSLWSRPLLARLEANGSPTFKGHIVIRQDSPLQNLEELKGKVMAFGDPNSTMGTMVPQAMLLEAGIHLSDLAHYHHYDGHTNVALAVLTGDADAGAVKEEVFTKYADSGLKSLQQTPAISEHVFVASSELDGNKVRQIRELLLGINTPDKVKRILKPLKASATGLVSASEADYLPLRRLMEKLDR